MAQITDKKPSLTDKMADRMTVNEEAGIGCQE